MTPAHVTRGNRRYRYYTCSAAQKNGWHTCPSKSLPAATIEQYVLGQIAAHATNGPWDRSAWQRLAPLEQAQRLRAVVARVDYDGTCQQVTITLRPPTPTRTRVTPMKEKLP
jgi:hypothetical protein